MARGYPDYTNSKVPWLYEVGSSQSMWTMQQANTNNAGQTVTTTLYTVPTGKKLFILGYTITVDYSAINAFAMLIDDTIIYVSYFDIIDKDSFPYGSIVLTAGQLLKIRTVNNDSALRIFLYTVRGYLIDA